MKKTGCRLLTIAFVVGAGVLMAGLSANGVPAAAVSHQPRIAVPRPPTRVAGWASSNWSGYALTGSAINSVTGRWTVPAVSASSKATYSADWVGIDGFNNSSLIQTGTESDYYAGSAHYDTWWEILPAAETIIPSVPVKPGDVMRATLTKGPGTSWNITINDVTTGKSFTTTRTYTGPRTSAEWIAEAPSVGGRVAPLAKYRKATFDPGTVNGANPRLTASESGVMVQSNVQVSTPSNPDGDTDGFNVAYGSTAPAPPSS